MRQATENVAGPSADVDAGWDEAPTYVPKSATRAAAPERTLTPPPVSMSRKVSATHTPAPSLPPVARAPRPSPSGRAPRAVTANLSWMERATLLHEQLGVNRRPSGPARVEQSVREEPTLVREEPTLVGEPPTLVRDERMLYCEDPTLVNEEPTLEITTDYVSESDISDVSEIDDVIAELARELDADASETVRDDELFGDGVPKPPPLPHASPRTSDFDIPDFRPYPFGRGKVVAAMGACILLAVAFAVTRPFAKPAATSTGPSGARPLGPAIAQPLPSQPPPDSPSPEPAASPAAPASAADPPLQLAPVEVTGASPAVAVTIQVIPSRAVVFRAGEKLGAGSVTVNVTHAAKQRLTALHDGYLPYNFTIDGSRRTVTVRLKRASGTHVDAPEPVGDPASAAPTESSEPSPAAPAPESAP